MANPTDNWPKHPDGRNKKIGEMTPDEAERVTREAVEKIAREFAPQGVTVRFCGTLPPGMLPPETKH